MGDRVAGDEADRAAGRRVGQPQFAVGVQQRGEVGGQGRDGGGGGVHPASLASCAERGQAGAKGQTQGITAIATANTSAVSGTPSRK